MIRDVAQNHVERSLTLRNDFMILDSTSGMMLLCWWRTIPNSKIKEARFPLRNINSSGTKSESKQKHTLFHSQFINFLILPIVLLITHYHKPLPWIKMAPLIDDSAMDLDMSLYGLDQAVANKVTVGAPLHLHFKQRCVSFCAVVGVHQVLNRDDFTPEERKSCWYDRVDLRQMKEITKSEARLMECGLQQESEDVCLRGLECRTKEGARTKRQNRSNAIAAVFFELDGQEDDGIFDDEAVADVYFNCSEHCQVSAQMLGMRDAREAQLALAGLKSDFVGSTISRSVINLSVTEGLISSAA